MDFNEIKYTIPSYKRCATFAQKIIEQISKAENAKEVKKLFMRYQKYSEKIETNFSIIHVLYTIDTTNKEFAEANEKCDNIMPQFSELNLGLVNAILAKPFRKDIEDEFGKYLIEEFEIRKQVFNPSIIPELIEQNKLVSSYNALLASAKIEYKGQVYNLSQLGKFSHSLDRKERFETSKLFENFLSEHNDELGEIYDKLVHLRDKMANKLGLKNAIELSYKNLGRVDWNAEMAKSYRKQILDVVVPICNKLIKRQAKRIKIKNPEFYDLGVEFLSGNAKPAGDANFLVKQAQTMYDDMSPEIGTFFKMMVDSHLLDLEAKPGKAPGGYMTQFNYYKVPFVFSNFNGTAADIEVITHEIGHAFQYYEARNIKINDYKIPGLEACEIHSMSMEFLTWPWIHLLVGDNNDAKYRFAHLSDAIEFLPYGAAVDEFQEFVYENVNITHKERCEKWKEIANKYLPYYKYDGFPIMESCKWERQTHIFEVPFYYLDYTLAQVVAFQFLGESLKNREKTWKKYVKLCKCGGKYPFRELLAKNHLRDPFVEGTMKKNIKPLIKLLDSFDDKNM